MVSSRDGLAEAITLCVKLRAELDGEMSFRSRTLLEMLLADLRKDLARLRAQRNRPDDRRR